MLHEARRGRRTIAIGMTAAMVTLFVAASPIAATGTCPGSRSEHLIAEGQRDLDPLAVYDKNGDWIVCVSEPTGRFKVVKYSDNKI